MPEIYKICHIRSPNNFKDIDEPQPSQEEGQPPREEDVALRITNNTLYVFFGNVVIQLIEDDEPVSQNINDLFKSNPDHEIFKDIFRNEELESIKNTNINVVFLPDRIYPDDSIETIKKKFLIHRRLEERITYGDMYMFCKQVKYLKSNHVYDQLTSNGRMEITPIRIQNFLLNIDNHPIEVVNYGGADLTKEMTYTDFTKLGEPSSDTKNYGYSNIVNLKLEESPRLMNVVIGQELSSVSYDYPYAVNPFESIYMDPFLETHVSEIINTTNKQVLLDMGDDILYNTIYLTTAEDVLQYTDSLASSEDIEEKYGIASFPNARIMTSEYALRLYFPYLAVFRDDETRVLSSVERTFAASQGEVDLSTIHSLETLRLHREKIYEQDNKIMNENFMRQTSNVKLLYDIYERRTSDHNYVDHGIRGIEFIIHPDTNYNLSIDTLFKKIHCDKDFPFIKLNPGKRIDNIYKLFISGSSKSGRKIPFLPKSDIFRLMKTCSRKKSVSVYIHYTYFNREELNHKANNTLIPVICEIHPDGCIHVKSYFTYSFSERDVTDIIFETVNPVLKIVKSYVEQSGYEMKLFKSLFDDNIDIVNIEYFSQLAITRNIEIKTMIKCISSVFNEIEGSLKKGILLRYKRVSNYNDMTSQEAYIVEMMNKKHTDREIIDGLRMNYMLNEQDAKLKIAGLLNSIQLQQLSRYRGGAIRIKNNPGFLTKITKGQFNNVISVEISNINNMLYLELLQIYIDSIIRIYQDPTSTDVPSEDIDRLCKGVIKNPDQPQQKVQGAAAAAAAAKASYLSDEAPLSLGKGEEFGVGEPGSRDLLSGDVRLSSDDGGELSAFMQVSQNKAVVKEVNRDDKENDFEEVAEITSATRKPYTESVTSAILGENVVFGFEAESSGLVEGSAAKMAPANADNYDAFFDLMDLDEDALEENEDENARGGGRRKLDNTGLKAQGGVESGAAKPKKNTGSSVNSDSDSEQEDMSDITGMELSNPNPFSRRIQERDPEIHLNEDVGKFNAYSRSCPGHYGRQPVILTDEEKARIDKEHPGSYSQSIKYGSNPKNQYNYICPRYWSLKHNTSLTEEEVKSGKFGKVIPNKAKKIPPGTNIFEFTDDKYHVDEHGNYKQHYPGFLKKDVHPKGLCVPCCFSQWDKPSQTKRRQECEIKQHEEISVVSKVKGAKASAAAAAAAAAAAPESNIREEIPEGSLLSIQAEATSSLPAAGAEAMVSTQLSGITTPKAAPLSSETSFRISDKRDERILSSDKFPLDENRWGYLPIQIQKFLFTDNRNCQISLKNASLKKDTPCLLRRGVEASDKQSFLSVIAYYYMERKGKIKTSAIPTGFGYGSVGHFGPLRSKHSSSSSAGAGAAGKPKKMNPMEQIIESSLSNEENVQAGESTPSARFNASKLLTMLTKHIENTTPKPKSKHSEDVMSSREEDVVVSSSAIYESDEGEREEGEEGEQPSRMNPGIGAEAIMGQGSRSDKTQNTQYILSKAVPTIREMRDIIKSSLDLDIFITLQNGTLVDLFYNNKTEIQDKDIEKYKSSEIYKSLQRQKTPENTEITFQKMCNAFENFISYLSKDDVVIDHTYLWDIVSFPNPRLFNNGNNIILIHIPDDDITNNVQVICPTNSYSGDTFDLNRRTIIIMKRDKYYEPICSFEMMSSGKINIFDSFSLKDKTLNSKLRHVIELIRDIYFSYCRLHSSQPRQYKYVMNKPVNKIAKMLKDSNCKIISQVMNYNGKVIGLYIEQIITTTRINPTKVVRRETVRKLFSGVIPTAASAPLLSSSASASASASEGSSESPLVAYEYPIVMMDDDELWMNTYQEEVLFLNQVADHVKKKTNQVINCRPKVKVIEEGFVVGIITETNQFVKVIPEKLSDHRDDGIPAATEGNQLFAETDMWTQKPGSVDKVREKYVRNVRLETNFYNVFRNTARIIMNKPENKSIKDEIEKVLNSPFIIYTNKLTKMVELMKRILSKYVGFTKYPKEVLNNIGEISGCVYNDDKTCSEKKYCTMRESGGLCKLLLPQRNLMHRSIDNSIAYYGKLIDEMIRYERVKLFMFEPTKYLTFQETKYNLYDDEIILLESLITQEYFENLDPVDTNMFVKNTNFYTVNPNQNDGALVQAYDSMYRKGYVDSYKEMHKGDQGEAVAVVPASNVPIFHSSEINHFLTFCGEVTKRKVSHTLQRLFFPRDAFEILMSNESEECSFDVMLTILRAVAQSASKCPSGHTCNRTKRKVKGGPSAADQGESRPFDESSECKRCHTNIGVGDTEFVCARCNYFVCDNCQHQHVEKLSGMNVVKLKEILVDEYAKLASIQTFDKKLNILLNGYGMKKYANLILEGKTTLATVIQSDNYFLTNVDIWVLARYFKIPIVFVSQGSLIENGKNMLVLYGDPSIETYFFIHPFGVTQGIISRYGLIELKVTADNSVFRIPLNAVSPELREMIAREIDADEPYTLEKFITSFKISHVKNKPKPVFVNTEIE